MLFVLIAVGTWAIVATVALAVLVSQRDDRGFPELFAPVTDEERKALDDASVLRSKLEDALIRLKHAEQERDRRGRDAKELAAQNVELTATLWRVRRAVDGHREPVMTTAERAG